MKTVAITTGNFATSEGNKGNFTANSKGQQIFIHKNMLEGLGITTNEQFNQAKPLYALIDEKTFTPTDEDGKPMESFTRLQAVALYKTKDELIEADLADTELEVELQVRRRQFIEKTIKTAELTEASVQAILSASSLI